MTDKIDDLKEKALEELQEEVSDARLDKDKAEELVFEIADSTVPIYYSDIATYLPDVGHDLPEVEGDSIYNMIQIAILEEIQNHLYEWISNAETCDCCDCILVSDEEEAIGLCEPCQFDYED